MGVLEQGIKHKIEKIGTPLKEWNVSINYGIKTGFNDAFIISGEQKDNLISQDPRSAELIRPILRGRDIKRYELNFADLWIINVHNGLKSENIPPINIADYPAVKQHLDQYYDKLEVRADKGVTPYNLRNCAYMNDFCVQKIVYREISDNMNACLVKPDIYINNKCYMITGDHLIFLLSIFNSTLFNKIILQGANTTGGKGFAFLEKIKIPIPSKEIELQLIDLYEQRQLHPEDSISIDELVDEIVFKLYQLSDDEILAVKGM